VSLTTSFTILTRLDGEVLAQVTKGWPGTTTGTTVTWTRVKIHASGTLTTPAGPTPSHQLTIGGNMKEQEEKIFVPDTFSMLIAHTDY
jgi:hypothetical protein